MGTAMKLMLFSFAINIAVAIIVFLACGNTASTGCAAMPMSIASWGTNQSSLNAITDSDISGYPVESSSSSFSLSYRILDFISLGLFTKLKDFAYDTIFAFPALLYNMGFLNNGLLFLLTSLFTAIYTFGMFELFTGRSVAK